MSFRYRRITFGLLLAAFACRALVPAGFMPAPLSAGGPIVVCPGGLGGAVLTRLARHASPEHAKHGQHEHPSEGYDAWEFCPQGASFAAAAPAAVVDFEPPVLAQVLEAAEPPAFLPRLIVTRYRARAPPTV